MPANSSRAETLPTTSIYLCFSSFHPSPLPHTCDPELDHSLSSSSSSKCGLPSGPCFSHSPLLVWFIQVLALALVHSFTLPCNIPGVVFIFPSLHFWIGIWVISSCLLLWTVPSSTLPYVTLSGHILDGLLNTTWDWKYWIRYSDV